MRKLLIVSFLAFSMFVLNGCASQSAQGQAPVQTNQVSMPPSYRFDPVTIQVKVGETVTWTNKDNFTHDVHLLGDINWKSPALRPGDATSYTFTKAGNFPYVCDFHSQDMKGEVIVTAQ
ncbi:MAG: cupredoxin domain-containing protein [Anaerolineaceae bacterium]|nr:cupredoxin domain-containing protein [Anaerolineaceae bacterium]